MEIEKIKKYIRDFIKSKPELISEKDLNYISENLDIFTPMKIYNIYEHAKKYETGMNDILQKIKKDDINNLDQFLNSKITKSKLEEENNEKNNELLEIENLVSNI